MPESHIINKHTGQPEQNSAPALLSSSFLSKTNLSACSFQDDKMGYNYKNATATKEFTKRIASTQKMTPGRDVNGSAIPASGHRGGNSSYQNRRIPQGKTYDSETYYRRSASEKSHDHKQVPPMTRVTYNGARCDIPGYETSYRSNETYNARRPLSQHIPSKVRVTSRVGGQHSVDERGCYEDVHRPHNNIPPRSKGTSGASITSSVHEISHHTRGNKIQKRHSLTRDYLDPQYQNPHKTRKLDSQSSNTHTNKPQNFKPSQNKYPRGIRAISDNVEMPDYPGPQTLKPSHTNQPKTIYYNKKQQQKEMWDAIDALIATGFRLPEPKPDIVDIEMSDYTEEEEQAMDMEMEGVERFGNTVVEKILETWCMMARK